MRTYANNFKAYRNALELEFSGFAHELSSVAWSLCFKDLRLEAGPLERVQMADKMYRLPDRVFRSCEGDPTGGGPQKPGNRAQKGGFSAAARTHKCNSIAGAHLKRNSVQRISGCCLVFERNIFKRNGIHLLYFFWMKRLLRC